MGFVEREEKRGKGSIKRSNSIPTGIILVASFPLKLKLNSL